MRNWFVHAFGIVLVSGMACAQDGKALYETYCGACHSPDGKGISVSRALGRDGGFAVQGMTGRLAEDPSLVERIRDPARDEERDREDGLAGAHSR
jgi:hypothetical protein